jgi:hypothetical protein
METAAWFSFFGALIFVFEKEGKMSIPVEEERVP